MKRKFADRSDWKRILDKTYKCIFVDDAQFTGHLAHLSLNKVREPLWVDYEEHRICIVDDGYVWLQHFPIDGEAVLTSAYDRDGRLVQCYFDIVKAVGTTGEGIPYCDDLYLDVVVLPHGEIYVLDEDELEEAYRDQVISEDDFEFAKQTASRLVTSIRAGTNKLMNTTQQYYEMLRG